MSPVLARRPARDETGAVTVMIALSMVAVLIAAAMVLDFGIARLDRQQNKAVADSAVAAGMRGLDLGDGRMHSFAGVCQALRFLKANKPELSSLSWATCNDPLKTATICDWNDPRTHASFTGTAHGITVEIKSPYDLTNSGWPEEQLSSLTSDQLTPQDACGHLAVIVRQSRQPGLGSIATDSDLTTAVRSVGRVAEGSLDDQPVALLLLERTGCNSVVVNGTNSFVRVLATGAVAGLIHSDSTGEACTGNDRILMGDHPSGIIAMAGTSGPGLIRVRSMGTPYAVTAYDTSTNVVAQNGAVSPGPLVSRRPVDMRYMSAARSAITDYETQAATNGASAAGWTSKTCNTPPGQLASVTGKLWISCGTNAFNTSNVTLNASTVFFDAKSISATNLAMPNATRVYVRGDTSTNGNGVTITGSSFSMGAGSSNAQCPDTRTTPTLTRARLVIGAGSFSANPSSTVKLCGTTLILRGGVTGGCIPSTFGTAPSDTVTCNGRISMSGATDWTAPNRIAGQATATDWNDFEDLAVWAEASGSHDIGGGAAMRLSGIFFLPNGDFKVHGGANQYVRNSQYIARHFRADGGSQLELQPNPYDVIGVPALISFTLVR